MYFSDVAQPIPSPVLSPAAILFNPSVLPQPISLPPVDETQMEEWLFAIENTRHTVTLPINLALHFANLTRAKLDHLDEPSILEFYKLLYSRVVKFTSYIEEFSSQLSTNDRKFLLSHNLEALAIVRLAQCFDPKKATLSQLKEFGRPDIPIGHNKIEIWQIFRQPWAVDDLHVDLYCRAVMGLANLPHFDVKSSLLLQLIALFNTSGTNAGGLENHTQIERQQEIFTEMLLSYLRTKVGASKSNLVIHQYLNFLPTLRSLCEMIARHRV